jgi:toxin YoeB
LQRRQANDTPPVAGCGLTPSDRSFSGIGKPEPLKHAFQGWWSRRIDGEHRIVYKIAGDQLWIAQLRYHY